MLKVHICEDNLEQLKRMEKIIEDIIQLESLNMQKGIVSDNPEIMLNQIKEEKQTGIFFLDVDLNHEMNGIALASKIREYQPRCFIIFVTTHSEMSFMTFSYKVEAMDYVIKDNFQEIKNRVHQCLLHVQQLYVDSDKKGADFYSVKVGGKVQEISYDDILYFEAVSGTHKIVLHTVNKVIEHWGKMKDIESAVGNRFYRCHRAYLVNRVNIKSIDQEKREIVMNNGEICPMSVRLAKGI